MIKSKIPLTILFILFCSKLISQERADIVVAQDGSEKYSSIQQALDAVPQSHSKLILILIKKGVYHEKIFIQKSKIALVGENQDSTCIVFAELRSKWNETHKGSDWGTAVINIDSTVTDLTLANLTVRNNYGSLYGTHDHQFAVWGKGTRIIILNCTIVSDGGDALSLWNRPEGMYYHANCKFEGWVDYVCPRGWCYITDCKFYGHNLSASIWHDGSTNKNQKFVIRYSYFDGVENFPLGRNHRDGQFYLLDCIFSKNMADMPIYYPPTTTSGPWKWGDRHYFHNCHREGGDFDWFANNLQRAEESPTPDQITPQWTFDGKWDPEANIPSVLPFVSLPFPRDGSYKINGENVILKWIPARNTALHNVYFGRTKKFSDPIKLSCVSNQKETIFRPGKLDADSTYYWRIDEVMSKDTLVGPLWHFTTKKEN